MSERHKPQIKASSRRLSNKTTRRQSQLSRCNSRLQTWRREVRHQQHHRHSTSSNGSSRTNNNTPLASATIQTRERARQRLLRRWPRQPQHRTWQRQRRLDGLSAAQSWLVKLATRQRTDRSKRPSRIKTPKCQVIRVVEILLDTPA